MLTIINAKDYNGQPITLNIDSKSDETIDAKGLTALPGLIDPHVHFRTPGQEYKENWVSAAKATIAGGYTTVFDMPNNIPACVTEKRLHDKIQLIDQQLKEADVPLHYRLYLGADRHSFDQIVKVKDQIAGVKIFMGSSTGDLLMDDDSSLHAAFAICGKLGLLVAIHAEDECEIQHRTKLFKDHEGFETHSKIRSPEVAAKAVELALSLARLYGTTLYILHVSSRQELELIAKAKAEGVAVFAETSPHHLFMNTHDYAELGGKAQMNPPLREPQHQKALFDAIHNGVIDTIGSDHAPHTLKEKSQPYRQAPSGVPGIETTLPLLLNAVHQGHISLKHVVQLAHSGPKAMFHYPDQNDWVLVDLSLTKTVEDANLKTRCQWSPFAGKTLTGWPVCTILRGKAYWLK